MSAEAKNCAKSYADFAKANASAKFVISGFHDASGNMAVNQELAKKRALTLRDELIGAGVKAESIETMPPADTLGGTDSEEARRVELLIAGK